MFYKIYPKNYSKKKRKKKAKEIKVNLIYIIFPYC